MADFIPFSLPDIDDKEIKSATETLKSGWITTGPKVKKFENNFQTYIGNEVNAIAVNSATAGLHLSLEALGVEKGDEVIVPSLTFTATASVVRHLGAEVRIVDIDPKTLNIDPKSIKNSINSKTKVIMPVHYAGLSCNMDEIISIAKDHNLKIIEDAAHALPTNYKGNIIGSLESDATVFSFYANKTMTTGEGGMIVTRNLELANRARIMLQHGIDRNAFNRFQSKKPSWYYEVVELGYKYNMTDIAAAIGIDQLKKLPKFLKRRQKLTKRYFESLADLPLILPEDDKTGGSHAWHLFVIRLKENARMKRDDFIKFLSNRGIGTSVHYVPLHLQPYWQKRYKLNSCMFPFTDKAYRSMISIPCYTAMSDYQQERIIKTIRDALT